MQRFVTLYRQDWWEIRISITFADFFFSLHYAIERNSIQMQNAYFGSQHVPKATLKSLT